MARQQATSTLSAVIEEAKEAGWSQNELKNCLKHELALPNEHPSRKPKKRRLSMHYFVFRLFPVLFGIAALYFPASSLLRGSPCVVSQLTPIGDVIHPLVDCEICRGLTEAPRLVNISRDDFVRYHAYQSKPVLVVGAAAEWPALELFSYDYFKELYLRTPGALKEEDMQFFAYSSNIANLKELFALPSEVATMSKEKWYIGW